MRAYLLLICALLVSFPLVSGATLNGAVYDLSLEVLLDVKVGIDTEPRQQIIAKNGNYTFNVPPGTYTLTAFEIGEGEILSSVQETVVITSEGEFVLDLILFPNLDEDLSLLSDLDDLSVDNPVGEESPITSGVLAAGILVLIALAIMAVLLRNSGKKEKKEDKNIPKEESVQPPTKGLPADLQQVIEIIQQEDGRITQRDLRKKLPLSEGKVSLMITDLEQRGLIEKIKKGRGNIIRLKD